MYKVLGFKLVIEILLLPILCSGFFFLSICSLLAFFFCPSAVYESVTWLPRACCWTQSGGTYVHMNICLVHL